MKINFTSLLVKTGLAYGLVVFLSNPKNIKRLKYFVIFSFAIFILISIVLLIGNFDYDLYKKEMDDIRKSHQTLDY
jgi:putative effector of murein hydrolase